MLLLCRVAQTTRTDVLPNFPASCRKAGALLSPERVRAAQPPRGPFSDVRSHVTLPARCHQIFSIKAARSFPVSCSCHDDHFDFGGTRRPFSSNRRRKRVCLYLPLSQIFYFIIYLLCVCGRGIFFVLTFGFDVYSGLYLGAGGHLYVRVLV